MKWKTLIYELCIEAHFILIYIYLKKKKQNGMHDCYSKQGCIQTWITNLVSKWIMKFKYLRNFGRKTNQLRHKKKKTIYFNVCKPIWKCKIKHLFEYNNYYVWSKCSALTIIDFFLVLYLFFISNVTNLYLKQTINDKSDYTGLKRIEWKHRQQMIQTYEMIISEWRKQNKKKNIIYIMWMFKVLMTERKIYTIYY